MHLVYIDEVKHHPGTDPYYWLCGLAIAEDEISAVESDLSEIARDYFGTNELSRDTEFHASHISGGKGIYKGNPIEELRELLIRLATIIPDHPEMGRIVVRLDSDRIARPDIEAIAFMYFVERVNTWIGSKQSKGLLIVDHDAQFVESNVQNLATYRTDGTDFEYGHTIKHLVDTVHHTHSHHSRLLQLADVFTYCFWLRSQKDLKGPRLQLAEGLRKLDPFYASKYKYWPPE